MAWRRPHQPHHALQIDELALRKIVERARGLLHPFVEEGATELARSLQFFFSSTPYERVDRIFLAGGAAARLRPDPA